MQGVFCANAASHRSSTKVNESHAGYTDLSLFAFRPLQLCQRILETCATIWPAFFGFEFEQGQIPNIKCIDGRLMPRLFMITAADAFIEFPF